MKNAFWMTTALATIMGFSYACSSSRELSGNDATPSASGLDNLHIPALNDAQLTTLSGDQAMLRLLVTDAPVEAEHVYVTFCGVQVQSHGRASEATENPSEESSGDNGGSTLGDSDAGVGSSADAGEALRAYADGAAPSREGDAGQASHGSQGQHPDPARGEARAHPVGDAGTKAAEAGWISLGDECQTFDLLALQSGISSELGFESLPPGSYGQIRLMLREARIVVDGSEQPLTIPSGVESGIKIVHGFELQAGSLTTLALDFDAARSIHENGGGRLIMRPVIELIGDRRESFQDVAARESQRSADSPSEASAEAARSSADPHAQGSDRGAASEEAGASEAAGAEPVSGAAHAEGSQPSDRANSRGQ